MEQNNNVGAIRIPLHKRFWYSITKFEKYPEMAAEGVGKAIGYLAWIMFLFAIIIAICWTIKFYMMAQSGEFSDIILETEISSDLFDKTELVDFLNDNIDNPQIYIIYAIAMTIYIFLAYLISALIDILVLSFFGWITTLIAQLKMRYRAIFNMSIYAITLSTVLQLIYIIIQIFTDFNIKYFDLMYTTIAFICLAAAIFMIRSDVIKQQIELMKIIEIRKQQQEQEKEKQEEQEQKEEKKEEKPEEKKKEEDNAGGNEAEGEVSS